MSNSFATPWAVAHQAPLSMGFSRQEYMSVAEQCPWCRWIILCSFTIDKHLGCFLRGAVTMFCAGNESVGTYILHFI